MPQRCAPKNDTRTKEPGYQLSLTFFRFPGVIPKLLGSPQEYDDFCSLLFFQRTGGILSKLGPCVKENLCKPFTVNKSSE